MAKHCNYYYHFAVTRFVIIQILLKLLSRQMVTAILFLFVLLPIKYSLHPEMLKESVIKKI